MAVLYSNIDVFISQIDAACEGNMSIYNQNFSMVPIIVVSGYKRSYRCEDLALDAQFLELLVIMGREGGDGAGAVVSVQL